MQIKYIAYRLKTPYFEKKRIIGTCTLTDTLNVIKAQFMAFNAYSNCLFTFRTAETIHIAKQLLKRGLK